MSFMTSDKDGPSRVTQQATLMTCLKQKKLLIKVLQKKLLIKVLQKKGLQMGTGVVAAVQAVMLPHQITALSI